MEIGNESYLKTNIYIYINFNRYLCYFPDLEMKICFILGTTCNKYYNMNIKKRRRR